MGRRSARGRAPSTSFCDSRVCVMGFVRKVRITAVWTTMIILLSGCGTYVPAIHEFWEGTESPILTAGGALEYKIKQKVYCGILEAVAVTRKEGILPRGWVVR